MEELRDNAKWYVLRVVSGKERKIKTHIETEIMRSKWQHIVSQILVPMEKVYQMKNGKKIIKERNYYPGYILIETSGGNLNGDIIQAVKSVTGVINFLGKTKPEALRRSEVNRILGKVDEIDDAGEILTEPFLVDESIKIIDGPFSGFIGVIEEVLEEKKKLKVIVKIFGRGTEVELNFMQVEKNN